VILGLEEGASLADIASSNGSSGEALVTGLLHLYSGQVDAKVTDEALSREHAAELLAAAEARLEQYVFAPHDISDRVADGARRRAERAEARVSAKQAVLELLGMTGEELKAALPGTSLAAVAEAAGLLSDDLTTALVAPVAAALDAAVAADRLTRDEADARLAAATTRAEQRIAEIHPVRD
jgi:lambda repressor-like predicted transcriptional regulator